MNQQLETIFRSHFEQVPEQQADFKHLGIPYAGKWRNNDSMAFFLNDLDAAFEETMDEEGETITTLKEKIEDLEDEIKELEDEIKELEDEIKELEKEARA